MSGKIPTEVGLLSLLTDLGLSNNLFSGPIPSELGAMTQSILMIHEGLQVTVVKHPLTK